MVGLGRAENRALGCGGRRLAARSTQLRALWLRRPGQSRRGVVFEANPKTRRVWIHLTAALALANELPPKRSLSHVAARGLLAVARGSPLSFLRAATPFPTAAPPTRPRRADSGSSKEFH